MQHIETFIEEGLTNRDISEKLGRSEAGIRNIRYRKGLVNKAESESKILFQQRDGLKRIVWALQGQKTSLTTEVAGLKKEKEKLEASINTDKILLHGVLAKALMNLKQRRPDLFYLTGQDQLVSLVRLFLGFISE